MGKINSSERFTSNANKVIAKARYEASKPNSPSSVMRNSMLDMLLKHTSDEDSAISDEELRDNVMTFYAAGSETTAVAINWAVFYLSQNKKIVEEIRKEVDGFFVNNLELLYNVTDVVGTFKFCAATLKECLRMAPPAESIRMDMEDDIEEYQFANGIVLSKGDSVMVNIDSYAFDEVIFQNSREFNPSRW